MAGGIVIIGVVFATLLSAHFLGRHHGDVARQHMEAIRQNEQMIRSAFRKPELFAPEFVRCSWPGHDGWSDWALALDRQKGKLALLQIENGKWAPIQIEPGEMLSVELLEDSRSVGTVSRTRQLGGAIAGGLLAGAAGAAIGGLTTGQGTADEVSRVGLLILLSFPDAPDLGPIDFCLWDRRTGGSSIDLGPEQQRAVRGEARKWFRLLQEFMERGTDQGGVSGQRNCMNCGHVVAEVDQFCRGCGTALTESL